VTRSAPSPGSKKKKSPPATGANESSMPSVGNLDELVGMDSFTKVTFQRQLHRDYKYTKSYLDDAYNIVHDFWKCDIHIVHEVKPKKGEAVSDDEEKKAGVSDPSRKQTKGDSPNSNTFDSPLDEMVIGFPPTANEMAYIKGDCLGYLYESGPVDIGLDFMAVDTLVFTNLTHSSFQYTDYWKLIHDFNKFFTEWLFCTE
jgi:hypothetical protein